MSSNYLLQVFHKVSRAKAFVFDTKKDSIINDDSYDDETEESFLPILTNQECISLETSSGSNGNGNGNSSSSSLLLPLIDNHQRQPFEITGTGTSTSTSTSIAGPNKNNNENDNYDNDHDHDHTSATVDIENVTLNKNNTIEYDCKKHDEPVTTTSTTATTGICAYEIWKARLFVLGAAMLTGSNFIAIKIMNESMPVGIHSVLRFGTAALFSLPWLFSSSASAAHTLAHHHSNNNNNKEGIANTANSNATTRGSNLACIARGVECGLWDGIAYLSQALGLRTVSVAVSSFTCSANIVLIPVLDSMIGITVLRSQWLGATVAMVGVGILILLASANEHGVVVGVAVLSGEEGLSAVSISTTTSDATATITTPTAGDLLLTLLQPIGFGLAFWRLGHGMERYPGQVARLTASQMIAVFAMSVFLALREAKMAAATTSGDDLLSAYPWKEWFGNFKLMFCILYAGLGTDLLGNFLLNSSRASLSSLESFLIYSTEQIWAVIFAAIFFGETIGMGAIFGAILIMIGCLIASSEIPMLEQIIMPTSTSMTSSLTSLSWLSFVFGKGGRKKSK